jgi:hypothetical protein
MALGSTMGKKPRALKNTNLQSFDGHFGAFFELQYRTFFQFFARFSLHLCWKIRESPYLSPAEIHGLWDAKMKYCSGLWKDGDVHG